MSRIMQLVCFLVLVSCAVFVIQNAMADEFAWEEPITLTENDITITKVEEGSTRLRVFWDREDLKRKGELPRVYTVWSTFPKADFIEYGGSFTPLSRVLYLENQ